MKKQLEAREEKIKAMLKQKTVSLKGGRDAGKRSKKRKVQERDRRFS